MGAASERAILDLIDTYSDALPEGPRETFRRKVEKANVAHRFDCLAQSMKASRSRPAEFASYMDFERKMMFHHIRMTRNEAGHPHVTPDLRADTQEAVLKVFDTYLQDVYSLIAYYRQSGPPVLTLGRSKEIRLARTCRYGIG